MLYDYFLIGDIGGTHFRLAVVKSSCYKSEIVYKEIQDTKKIKSIENTITDFLDKVFVKVERAIFGVAGPKIKNKIKMTNSKLEFDLDKIKNKTSLKNVEMFNDMRSVVYSIPKLEIKKKSLIIGIGTGVGVCYFESWNIIEESEDGHLFFEPKNDFDKKFVIFLNKKQVTWEDILSGDGFQNLYKFLFNSSLSNEEISKKNTMRTEKFFNIYSKYLQRFIYTLLERNDIDKIYLVGGVVTNNFSNLKLNLKVELIKDKHAGLLGLMEYSKSLVPENKIIPTLFAFDRETFFSKLESAKMLTDTFHIDFCDGKFVHTKTVSFEEIEKIKDYNLEFQVHLMAENPSKYFEILKKLNIRTVMMQFEVFDSQSKLTKTIEYTEKQGFNFGLVINPNTPIESLIGILSRVNLIMLMSVNPGREGQGFINETYTRVRKLKSLKPTLTIQVDGGIKDNNIRKLQQAGAQNFCVGSFITSAKNPAENFEKLRQKLL